MTVVPPGDYYDREGNRISYERYVELQADQEYVLVAGEDVGPYYVSTVWLGLDHNWGRPPPAIFETMVFLDAAYREQLGELFDLDCQRFSAEPEAHAGHQEMVLLIRATMTTTFPDLARELERNGN